MQRFHSMFKTFDTFGVPLTLKLEPNEKVYKSSIGGLTTLVIYVLSSLYAAYIISQWYNNQMSPKMTTMRYQTDFSKIDLNYTIFQLCYYRVVPTQIDPFKENILTLMIFGQSLDGSKRSWIPIFSNSTSSLYNTTLLKFNQGINRFLPNGTQYDGWVYEVGVMGCVTAFLPNGSKCASNETIAKFFKQSNNVIVFTHETFTLDMLGNPQSSIQTYTIRVEQALTYKLNMDLQSNYYVLKDDVFTDKSRSMEYLSGASIMGQTSSMDYNKVPGLTYYMSFFLSLQPSQTKVIIEFAHIGEILASIGSIIQVLFLTKYIITLFNEEKLWDDLIEQTMLFYYPNLTHITYKYNWLNRIQSIYYKKQEIDKDQFLKFRKEVSHKIDIKLTYNNLVYEISRLYFLVRELANKNQIRNLHDLGIQLEFTNHDLGLISSKSYNPGEDLEMLSLIKREQYRTQINDEIQMQQFSPIVQSVE